jgi:hypothetical protein
VFGTWYLIAWDESNSSYTSNISCRDTSNSKDNSRDAIIKRKASTATTRRAEIYEQDVVFKKYFVV